MQSNLAIQTKVLEALAAAYPDPVEISLLRQGLTDHQWRATLAYLMEIGAVAKQNKITNLERDSLGHVPTVAGLVITKHGLSVVIPGGGLGVAINTLTVRLHDDTIRALLAARIDASKLPPEKKLRFKDHMKHLSEEALWKLFEKLLDLGLDQFPL